VLTYDIFEKVNNLCRSLELPLPNCILHVLIDTQQMVLNCTAAEPKIFMISTSRFGVGNREGSNMTPTGLHRITEKIGAGAPSGRIFKERIDTGIDWNNSMSGENCILTRILRLDGLETGVNKGPGIDSFERYIYIHGTNREEEIGTPLSHGCICMKNNDIIKLFDLVEEGTLVFIDQ